MLAAVEIVIARTNKCEKKAQMNVMVEHCRHLGWHLRIYIRFSISYMIYVRK